MLRVFPRRYRTLWLFSSLIVVSTFFYIYQVNMNANLPHPEEMKTNQEIISEEVKEEMKIADLFHPSHKAITFYYPWYGNPTHNEQYIHWNHQVLVDNGKYYIPPDDIGANFYPSLGPYSSTDPAVIDQHMKWMAEARIGVLCTSWWGRSASDSQLEHVKGFTDSLVTQILDAAHKYGLKVAIHLEPYKGRNAGTVKEDLRYLISEYGNHPGLFRDATRNNRPFIFVYDSYHTTFNEWSTILHPNSPDTIRNTEHDAVMIALYVDRKDQSLITKGFFDGFYTYFATDGFTEGSTVLNWQQLSNFAAQNGKLFIPSVGPGYSDTRIRPWNGANQRKREDGDYYDRMFNSAINLHTPFISITSFNEWHEGTQIEPSMPKEVHGFTYEDFMPHSPEFYLQKTKQWIDKYDPVQ